MKICIVTHKVAKGDGQGRVNYEVTQAALQRGHQVTLVASSIANELTTVKGLTWVPISIKGVPTELLRNLIFANRSAQWLIAHQETFDVIKVNGAITWVPGDFNAAHFVHGTWLRSPAHTWAQQKSLYGFYQWLYTVLNAYWEKKAFTQAKQVIAVSSQVKFDLQKIGVPEHRICVIYNGVDTSEFYPGSISRKTLGLPEDVPVAIFVGDIRTPRKNLDSVLKALARVSELHLLVVGNLDNSPFPELSRKLSIHRRVHFLGYRQDIPHLLRASDFLVFPSRYETFGLVVLEAMASGIPVLTTMATPASELVTSEAGIVLSDPNDINALEQGLNYLTRQTQQRQRMGICARSIAEQYSWNKMAQRYIDVFEGKALLC